MSKPNSRQRRVAANAVKCSCGSRRFRTLVKGSRYQCRKCGKER